MTVTKLKPEPDPTGPPADLAPIEAQVWRDLQAEYDLSDAAAAVLLGLLCRSLQLARECRETVERDGKLLANGREHALLRVQRDADKQAQNALRALNLDLTPLHPKAGRRTGCDMPTKRKRFERGSAVPYETFWALTIGTGINHCDQEWLREQWRRYGKQVTAQCLKEFGDEPYCAWLAREEGWDPPE